MQELATTSNDTDQCKFNPIDYYVRDTYRTRNLNIRTESRRIRVNGKEQEHRFRFRVEDIRNIRLTRSESLPNIRLERIRNAKDIDFRSAERRTLEWNNRRLLDHHINERTFRREVRDNRHDQQTRRDNTGSKMRIAYTRQVLIYDK